MQKKTPPTLIVDSREKKPWNFDSDPEFASILVQKLEVGDYSILGLEKEICIERKLSADELYVNFSTKEHRERFRREMERFRDVTHRFIIIEEELSSVLDPRSYYVNKSGRNKKSEKMPIAVIMRELMHFMLHYGVHVVFAGGQGQKLARSLLLQVYKESDVTSIVDKEDSV